MVEALRSLGIEAYYEPINDISSTDGKIGGAAQTRTGGAVLHHTTMACEMDARKMLEVLNIGGEKLSDKAVKSADKRVGPIRRQTQLPREEVIEALISTFSQWVGGNLTEDQLSEEEMNEAGELARSRYGTREWNYLLP